MNVRNAVPDDAVAIARLLGQLGYPIEPDDVPARLARMAGHHRGAVLLAVDGEHVIGLATIHILSVMNRVRDVAWLTALVVDETVRGSGVGRTLVAAVEAFARESDCERLTVTTYEGRKDAQAFYLRIGFELTGRRFGKVLTK